MSDGTREDLLSYYLDELTYLREMGGAFAKDYPKVAALLELGNDESRDPHVERLIESFAFLTGRIQRNLHQQFPEISASLLNNLYPHYLQPIPSMSIAQFVPDPTQGMLTEGYDIPPETPLVAQSQEGVVARFRTCLPLTLWPLTISSAGIESTKQEGLEFLGARSDVASIVRIRFECAGEGLKKVELDRVRLYVNGELRDASRVLELIMTHTLEVAIQRADGAIEGPRPVKEVLHPVGFGPEDFMFPAPAHAHPGYRLLAEYFAFPRKYLFFDVLGLDVGLEGTSFDLLFLLDRVPASGLRIRDETFRLGCTPIINLFPKTTEPIRLDHRQVEYRLMPDVRRERSTEIHSINFVSRYNDETRETGRIKPYFAYSHQMEEEQHSAFWHARRKPTGRSDVPGTEMFISFVDLHFDPLVPPVETVYANALCTNRRLAEELPAGAALQFEQKAPQSEINILHAPTPQLDPPMGGQTPWRLVSHLTLNHLSLDSDEGSVEALREILTLYAPGDSASVHRQIDGIREVSTCHVVGRLPGDAWRGFCRGTEVTVTLDEAAFTGTHPYLLASVLRHFLGLYASANSFTGLVVKSTLREGEWYRWPPLAGRRELL